MHQEVSRLLAERHTVAWMQDALDSVLLDIAAQEPDRDVSMNDVVSAFVCAMMREKEFFRSEYSIGF